MMLYKPATVIASSNSGGIAPAPTHCSSVKIISQSVSV